MAAHLKTVLEQLQNGPIVWEHLSTALEYSCWTEDLELSEYCDLEEIVIEQNADKLAEFVTDMLEKYSRHWSEMGEPRTREEWLAKLYG